MRLQDYQMEMIANYLIQNPPLEHLNISENLFKDEGMKNLCAALEKNANLIHLVFFKCDGLTHVSLQELKKVLTDINTDLYELYVDIPHFKGYEADAIACQDEAKKNKNIRLFLKPTVRGEGKAKHVEFQSDVKEYFPSAVKCWQIYKPGYLDLTEERLEDAEIKLLVQYLMKTGGINQLILRRNLIGDEGAQELATFIEKNVKAFNNIELSRNNIGDIGAKAIYKALRKNTRIHTLLINFGNQISKSILQKIEIELNANHHIKGFVKKFIKSRKLTMLDKGPEFLRCALKSAELLNLQALDLSDNLISAPQVKQIAKSLKMNIPLKILKLSNNLIDIKGAQYLADALKVNSNLRMLFLDRNQLGDKGIASIILPIAKQHINKSKIFGKSSMFHNQLEHDKHMKEMTKLYSLDFSFNQHSKEALKHVYALLFANSNMVVRIDDPEETKLKEKEDKDQEKQDSQKVANSKNNTPHKGTTRNDGSNRNSPLKGYRKTVSVSPSKSKRLSVSSFGKHHKGSKRFKDDGKLSLGRHQFLIEGSIANYIKTKQKNTLIFDQNNNFQRINSFSDQYEQISQGGRQNIVARNGLAPISRNDSMMENSHQQLQLRQYLEENIADQESNPNTKQRLNQANNFRKSPLRPQLELNKNEPSKYTITDFIVGKDVRRGDKKRLLQNMIGEFKKNKKDATTFQCNENILFNVECISQKYVTAAIYISTFAFYFSSIIVPLTESKDCLLGHPTQTYILYGIYIALSAIMELILCLYLQRIVKDHKVLRFNKFHLSKIVTGQLARMDFFTDTLFVVQLYSCEYYHMMYASIVILTASSWYSIFMIFRLMRKDHSTLLENIERNCKLAYISEHHALAIILDSFSLNNFESVGERTITVPKIVSSIKSFVEDLPQFVMQVIYLLYFTQNRQQSGTIYLSILLGAFSFGMSLHHSFTAKSSNVNKDAVKELLKKRQDNDQGVSLEDGNEDKISQYEEDDYENSDTQMIDMIQEANNSTTALNQNEIIQKALKQKATNLLQPNQHVRHSNTMVRVQPLSQETALPPKVGLRRLSMLEIIGESVQLKTKRMKQQQESIEQDLQESPINSPIYHDVNPLEQDTSDNMMSQVHLPLNQMNTNRKMMAYSQESTLRLNDVNPLFTDRGPQRDQIKDFQISDGQDIVQNIMNRKKKNVSYQTQSQDSMNTSRMNTSRDNEESKEDADGQNTQMGIKFVNIQKTNYNQISMTNNYQIKIQNQIIQSPSNNQ